MTNSKVVLAMAAVFVSGSFSANAYTSGTEIATHAEEYLKSKNGQEHSRFSSSFFMGYVASTSDRAVNICYPKGIKNGQVNKAVALYIQNNPSKLHLSADGLVYEALADAWHCRKGEPN